MPAVRVTIDYMDGSTRVVGPLYPDEIDLRGMLFKLNEREIASITFVRADPITYLRKKIAAGESP
jgi:hypothetical protein